jgi:hypothetical protein
LAGRLRILTQFDRSDRGPKHSPSVPRRAVTLVPGMRAPLEFLDEWCSGKDGDYFDYTLLLRSPLLAGCAAGARPRAAWATLFTGRAVMAVTALREALCLI